MLKTDVLDRHVILGEQVANVGLAKATRIVANVNLMGRPKMGTQKQIIRRGKVLD